MLKGDDRTSILPPEGHLELSQDRGYGHHCTVTLIHDGQGSITLEPLENWDRERQLRPLTGESTLALPDTTQKYVGDQINMHIHQH